MRSEHVDAARGVVGWPQVMANSLGLVTRIVTKSTGTLDVGHCLGSMRGGEVSVPCTRRLWPQPNNLVWGELLAYGTQGGQRLDEAQISLRMVLTSLSPP